MEGEEERLEKDSLREASRQLITTIALITTSGPHGSDVMSAEWTFQVSYDPMRFMVLVYPDDATYDNIHDSKEFGVNFLSDENAVLANIAGSYTGKEVNKLSSELFHTYPAKVIGAPMITGCFLNAECRLIQVLNVGEHTAFLGEVVNVQVDKSKNPLLYGQRQYWQRGPAIGKKRLIFLTCTIRNKQLLLEGGLQGADQYPQRVELTVKCNNTLVVKATVESDDQGYLTLVHPLGDEPIKGRYEATATWNELKGTANKTV
jgi:flavin reductase (DIM6/NTAB) family NADH-FMN oxidoreductase RutF